MMIVDILTKEPFCLKFLQISSIRILVWFLFSFLQTTILIILTDITNKASNFYKYGVNNWQSLSSATINASLVIAILFFLIIFITQLFVQFRLFWIRTVMNLNFLFNFGVWRCSLHWSFRKWLWLLLLEIWEFKFCSVVTLFAHWKFIRVWASWKSPFTHNTSLKVFLFILIYSFLNIFFFFFLFLFLLLLLFFNLKTFLFHLFWNFFLFGLTFFLYFFWD